MIKNISKWWNDKYNSTIAHHAALHWRSMIQCCFIVPRIPGLSDHITTRNHYVCTRSIYSFILWMLDQDMEQIRVANPHVTPRGFFHWCNHGSFLQPRDCHYTQRFSHWCDHGFPPMMQLSLHPEISSGCVIHPYLTWKLSLWNNYRPPDKKLSKICSFTLPGNNVKV